MHPFKRQLRFQLCLLSSLFLHSSNAGAKEYSIEDLVVQAKHSDLKVRIKAENLFRAHQQVRVALGVLMPGLNLGVIGSAASQSWAAMAENSCGFFFPSNWFQWKENRLLFQAERYSFISLIANEINTALSIAYQVHYVQSVLKMYEKQLLYIAKFVEYMQFLYDSDETDLSSLLMFKNMYAKIEINRDTLQGQFKKLKIDLANGIGLPSEEWPFFELKAIELPDLSNHPDFQLEEYEAELRKNSPDLITFEYLIPAAKYAMKVRMFDFLTPGATYDANVGVGYPSYLRIAKSMKRQLEIKKLETTRNLTAALRQGGIFLNMLIKLYRLNHNALQNELQIQYNINMKMLNGLPFKTDDFVNNINNLFLFESQLFDVQHKFLISLETIHKLLMREPHYDRLAELAPKKPKKHTDIIHIMENALISKAIANGKIELPLNADLHLEN